MKKYVLSIVGMALLTTIISVLIPQKKHGKIINGILKLCMLLTIVSPVFQYIQQDATNFLTTESMIGQDVAYINNSYAFAIEKQLKEQFDVTAQAEISFSASTTTKGEETASTISCFTTSDTVTLQCVKIYICDFGMNEESEHINIITQIAETVRLLCSFDGVEVYDASG